MPQRRRLVRVDTPELQGDDSWVELFKVNGHDGIRLMELRQRIASADDGNGPMIIVEAMKELCSIVLKYLVDWNWVNDDGEPLPKPTQIDDLMEILSYEEITGLSAAVRNARTVTEPQGN